MSDFSGPYKEIQITTHDKFYDLLIISDILCFNLIERFTDYRLYND